MSNGGGYEQAQYGNKEAMGPTYDMVMSEKNPGGDPQDAHWLGQLLPAAHSRTDEVRSFNAASVLG